MGLTSDQSGASCRNNSPMCILLSDCVQCIVCHVPRLGLVQWVNMGVLGAPQVGQLEGGVAALEWSPDGETVCLITGTGQMLLMTKVQPDSIPYELLFSVVRPLAEWFQIPQTDNVRCNIVALSNCSDIVAQQWVQQVREWQEALSEF